MGTSFQPRDAPEKCAGGGLFNVDQNLKKPAFKEIRKRSTIGECNY